MNPIRSIFDFALRHAGLTILLVLALFSAASAYAQTPGPTTPAASDDNVLFVWENPTAYEDLSTGQEVGVFVPATDQAKATVKCAEGDDAGGAILFEFEFAGAAEGGAAFLPVGLWACYATVTDKEGRESRPSNTVIKEVLPPPLPGDRPSPPTLFDFTQ